jgi:competence protein ComEA
MSIDVPPSGGWTPGGVERPPAPGPGLADGEAADRWGPLREFLRDRLPPALRGARLDPGVRGALALAGVALLAAIVAVVVAWSSSSRLAAKPAAAVPAVAVPKLPGATPAPAASSQPPDLVVDVAGKVRRPGLVKLPAGSRVADAIAAAGGALPQTSTIGMSLARKVIDGEQLVIGEPQPAGSTAQTSGSFASSGLLDLNTASASDLEGLPGIGPVLAQRVIDWRTAHGGFASVDQLREVSGLGGKKFDVLAPLVRV